MFHFENIDEPGVRDAMVSEIEAAELYQSKELTIEGLRRWPALLREAAADHSPDWLADQLREERLVRQLRRNGHRVPRDAHTKLANGQFNLFYARGLCASIVEDGGGEVEIYRGLGVASPRSDSHRLIGQTRDATTLLESLRSNHGVEHALEDRPNSGLSIRRV